MHIRKTEIKDLDKVMCIYRAAREFMVSVGNPSQWGEGEPSRETIRQDILNGDSNVVVEDGEILAVFYYHEGEDPTYKHIEGEWLKNGDYGVIHRIAVKNQGRGVASFVFNHCLDLCGSLRIDTHENNAPMQRALLKSGFSYCGTVYVANGTPRRAYQKCK